MKVLFTTDGSPASAHALREAARLLPLAGAEATVVGVAALPPMPEGPGGGLAMLVEHEVQAVRCALTGAVKQLAALGVEASAVDAMGDIPAEIREVATRQHVDLIVLGSHARTWLERAFAGSVSERVVHRWHGAALVVRPEADAVPAHAGPARVLVCVDGSEASLRAIDEALRLLPLGDAEVTVAAVADVGPAATAVPSMLTDGVPLAEEVRTMNRLVIARAQARLAAAGVPAATAEREGPAGPTLAALAHELGADLVVIGSHARGTLGRWVLGSVSDHVLRHGAGATFVVGPA